VDKALDFALALQADPGAPDIQIRAGIHIGEMQPEDGDLFGREVNFGARVVGNIKGSEIWLSEPAYFNVKGLGAARFKNLSWEPHDKIQMKGFGDEFRLWSLSSTDARQQYEPSPVGAPRPSLGVMDSVSRREFRQGAQNYDRVDFVSSAEVVIDGARNDHERGVYVQVDFVEWLYIESPRARVEFGVRRAFVTIENKGPGRLARTDHLRSAAPRRNARFVTLHDAPAAVSVCFEPDPGKITLGEASLPPTPRENYLCQIATATADLVADQIHAELRVSLDVEGLYLADDIDAKVTLTRKKQIEAILAVAAKKNHQRVDKGQICRPIQVMERERVG
jgi:hypothetical protein